MRPHGIYHTPLEYPPSPKLITSYDFVVVMYFISIVMIILTEPSFRIHMLKTLRRMSWRGRRSQKENRKSPKLPRSPKPQKSLKRRVLKGMYKKSPIILFYIYLYICIHICPLLCQHFFPKGKERKRAEGAKRA